LEVDLTKICVSLVLVLCNRGSDELHTDRIAEKVRRERKGKKLADRRK
jgi:hypothetical protein